MALISLDDMYQKWKKVSDWVTGVDTTSSPKVTVNSSALPTGAATEASIAAINTKLPALGVAAKAASMPVNIASDQIVSTVLTGRIEQILLSRGIRTVDVNISAMQQTPENARGLVVTLRIYGVTGTFATGEGLKLITYARGNLPVGLPVYTSPAARTQNAGSHLQIWQPGVVLGDATSSEGGVLLTGIPPQKYMSYGLEINGTFGGGEGFDCEVVALWTI